MCHVLIIEDEFFTSDHLMYVTGKAGATSFDQACTQGEAVRMALVRKPAVILCDMKLIEGSGSAAVHAIGDAYSAIPVIYVTASPETCPPCEPPSAVLTKPLKDDELIRAFHLAAPGRRPA